MISVFWSATVVRFQEKAESSRVMKPAAISGLSRMVKISLMPTLSWGLPVSKGSHFTDCPLTRRKPLGSASVINSGTGRRPGIPARTSRTIRVMSSWEIPSRTGPDSQASPMQTGSEILIGAGTTAGTGGAVPDSMAMPNSAAVSLAEGVIMVSFPTYTTF